MTKTKNLSTLLNKKNNSRGLTTSKTHYIDNEGDAATRMKNIHATEKIEHERQVEAIEQYDHVIQARRDIKQTIFSNKSGKPGHGLFPYRSEYLALYDIYNAEIYYESGNAKKQPPSLAEVYVYYMIWAGPARRVPREFQNRKHVKKSGESDADFSARTRSIDFVNYFRGKGFETTTGQVMSCKPETFLKAFRSHFIAPPVESYQRGKVWGKKSREEYTRSIRNFVMVLNNRKQVQGDPVVGKTFRIIPGRVQIPEAMKAMVFRTCKHEVCNDSCGDCTKCLLKAIAAKSSSDNVEKNRENQKRRVAERPRISPEDMHILRSSNIDKKSWKNLILKFSLGESRDFKAFLNGANGEVTGSDDVETKGGKLCEKVHGPDSCKKPIFHSMPGKKSSPEAERRLATKQEKEQGYKISKLTFCHESAISHICECPGNRKVFHLTKTQQQEWLNIKTSEERAAIGADVGEELESKALSGVSAEDLKKELDAFDKLVYSDLEEEREKGRDVADKVDEVKYVFSPKIPHKDDKPNVEDVKPPGNKVVIPACMMVTPKVKKEKKLKKEKLKEEPKIVEMVEIKKPEVKVEVVDEPVENIDVKVGETKALVEAPGKRNHDQGENPVFPEARIEEPKLEEEVVVAQHLRLDIDDEEEGERQKGENPVVAHEEENDEVEHRNQDQEEIPVVPVVVEVNEVVVPPPIVAQAPEVLPPPIEIPVVRNLLRPLFGPENRPVFGRANPPPVRLDLSDSESDSDTESDGGRPVNLPPIVNPNRGGPSLKPCPVFGKGFDYLPNEGLKVVTIGSNAASDVDLRSMIEKCCRGLFDFILYNKKENVVRLSDSQLCDLYQVEEGERSFINRFFRGVADNACTVAKGGWVDFTKNNTQKEVMVIVRSNKYRGDVTKKLWKFSRKAEVFNELYRGIMRNTMPMSSVGSLKNPTLVHMFLFSRIGEQIKQYCDDHKVLGYLEVDNAATLVNTIAYIHNTMVINFNLGFSSCQEYSVSPGALTFSLSR